MTKLNTISGVPSRRLAVGPKKGEEIEEAPSPVKKYTLPMDEIIKKYGPPQRGDKVTPIAKLSDPALNETRQKKKKVTCKNLNLAWDEEAVNSIIEDYNYGLPIWEISQKHKRKEMEVAILIAELAEEERIEPRAGGVYGTAN